MNPSRTASNKSACQEQDDCDEKFKEMKYNELPPEERDQRNARLVKHLFPNAAPGQRPPPGARVFADSLKNNMEKMKEQDKEYEKEAAAYVKKYDEEKPKAPTQLQRKALAEKKQREKIEKRE